MLRIDALEYQAIVLRGVLTTVYFDDVNEEHRFV